MVRLSAYGPPNAPTILRLYRNGSASLKKLNRWSDKHEDGTVTFDQNYLRQIDDLALCFSVALTSLETTAPAATITLFQMISFLSFLSEKEGRLYNGSEALGRYRIP